MLGLENAFMPRADFIARIQAHYTQQALAQIYKVLGSYEFMGSPVPWFLIWVPAYTTSSMNPLTAS